MIKKIGSRIKSAILHPYTKFVARKALFYLVVIFVSLSLTWMIPRFMPGSPVQSMMLPPPQGLSPEATEAYFEAQAFLISEFGLDKPLGEQYVDFWTGVLQGDFGNSFIHRVPVSEYIQNYMGYTLALVIPVLILSFFLGNYIGSKTAFMKGRMGKVVYNILILLQSAPFYWIGLLFYVFFVAKLEIFPTYGAFTPGYIPGLWRDISLFDPGTWRDFTRYLWLDLTEFGWHWAAPFLSLMVIQTGAWATGMRAMTLYEKDSEYLLYANQLGFKEGLVRRYAKRNAMLPQVTGLNMTLNGLIGQTILIEQIFGWPGLGSMNVAAMGSRDYPLIVGGFVITLLIVVVGNFIMDILYGFIDPRIRTGAQS